jgi:hypothetical protein
VLIGCRRNRVTCPLGLIAQARYDEAEWEFLPPERRSALVDLVDYPDARPDFLSWHKGDLPHPVPMLCRRGIGMPVMTWTVRSEAERERALQWADQIIFENFEA